MFNGLLGMRCLMIISLLCVFLFGCNRNRSTTNKDEVFRLYFHEPVPTNTTILKASNSEAYSVGLDEWELILDAELPANFLTNVLSVDLNNAPPAQINTQWFFGEDNMGSGIGNALQDRPSWFNPATTFNYTVHTNNIRLSFVTGYAVVAFREKGNTNRYQLWISDHGWSRLFIDKETGHIYAHNKFP